MAEANLNYQVIKTTHAAREAVRSEVKEKYFATYNALFRMIRELKVEKRI